jgi:hypothetical protein
MRDLAHRECATIQSPITFSAAGEIVSSILWYSLGAPVLAVWKRWLRPGSSTAVTGTVRLTSPAQFLAKLAGFRTEKSQLSQSAREASNPPVTRKTRL